MAFIAEELTAGLNPQNSVLSRKRFTRRGRKQYPRNSNLTFGYVPLRLVSRNSALDLPLRHLRPDHYKRLLGLMELGTGPPLVEFHTVSETKGLDLIERTRNAPERVRPGSRMELVKVEKQLNNDSC